MPDVVMHEQAIGIDDDGRAIPRDPSGADPVSVDTSAVPRDSHPPASSPADLARLTCEQDLRSFNASRGWLGAPTHYSGQRDVGTGVIHHHSTAQALLQVSAREHTPPHIGLFRHVIFATLQQVAANKLSGPTTAICTSGPVLNFRLSPICVACR